MERDLKAFFSLQGLSCNSIHLSKMFEKTIRTIRIHLNSSFMASKGIPHINVYLIPENTNINTFFTQPFTMSGDKLRDTGHNSIDQYRVQILRKIEITSSIFSRLKSQNIWRHLPAKVMDPMKVFYPAEAVR